MPFPTRDDIYLDVRCAACDGSLIIIPAHGMFVQHEDSELEADHRPTSRTVPPERGDYQIVVNKRIDEPGYRWRMGNETGVISEAAANGLYHLIHERCRATTQAIGHEIETVG